MSVHPDFCSFFLILFKNIGCHRYISDSSNENYDELLKTEDTWPVFYNLTDLRAALLSWYDIAPNAEVMAMGAGIGSLTGLLCEKAGRVAVVEQSMFRARTIAKRYNETKICWRKRK